LPTFTYQDKHYECQQSESVLDCLARHSVTYPSSCQNGICQTCLMLATDGKPPAIAQKGLKDTLQAQNYFLSCVCHPEEHLVISEPGENALQQVATQVVGKEQLNNDIMRFRLTSKESFDFRAGQFLHLKRKDGLVRSYSIASLPNTNEQIEIHVRRLDNGKMTSWLHDSVNIGDTIEIAGPVGECFYTPGNLQQNLLLVGTGSGLAPLWGIIRDALDQGHSGLIHLFHGSYEIAGLYLVDELKALAEKYPNFLYSPCVNQNATDGINQGRIDIVVSQIYPDMKGWRVFLCGHPDMVESMKKKVFLAGASLKDIYADSFVTSAAKKAV